MNLFDSIELNEDARAQFINLIDEIYNGNLPAVKSILSARKFPVDLAITKNIHSKGFEDSDAGSALMLAAKIGNLPICQALMNAGFKLDSESIEYRLTPLHFAAENGHLSVCQELLKNGASIRIRDREGNTPLDLAKNEQIKQLFASHIPNHHTGCCLS